MLKICQLYRAAYLESVQPSSVRLAPALSHCSLIYSQSSPSEHFNVSWLLKLVPTKAAPAQSHP